MIRASAAVIAFLIAASGAFAQSTPSPTQRERPTIRSSQPGEIGASELVGASVHAQAGELVGQVTDLILDKDGRITVVVVGASNFLGLGERDVAIDYAALSIRRDPVAMIRSEVITVLVDATVESLKTAPEWRWSVDHDTGRATVTPQVPATPGGTSR